MTPGLNSNIFIHFLISVSILDSLTGFNDLHKFLDFELDKANKMIDCYKYDNINEKKLYKNIGKVEILNELLDFYKKFHDPINELWWLFN